MNTFFLYLSMLRYYVIGVYKAINNITALPKAIITSYRAWRGSPLPIPNRVPPAQMVLQLWRVCRVLLKPFTNVKGYFFVF
jgi:hypothetical protein